MLDIVMPTALKHIDERNQVRVDVSMWILQRIPNSRLRRQVDHGFETAVRDFWGRGLMSEALAAVLSYAFEDLGMHRIEADVDPDHAASLALLEKFGFIREGILRDRWFVHGEWHDSVMLGLLADEFL